MKKKYLLIVCLSMFLASCLAHTGINVSAIFKSPNFQHYSFDKTYQPSEYELSVIHFILRNTPEVNIHRMRGETKNVVYVIKKKNKHGYSEAVFDENKQPVTNSYNQASFNFYLYETEPIKHFGYDMLPWLEWGNTRDDPTSFKERLFYYTLDLNIGIQSYIFKGSSEKLNIINFDKLPYADKIIYRFFCHIIFNKNYEIQLNEENKRRLKEDSEFYFKYFNQVQQYLEVKMNNEQDS